MVPEEVKSGSGYVNRVLADFSEVQFVRTEAVPVGIQRQSCNNISIMGGPR